MDIRRFAVGRRGGGRPDPRIHGGGGGGRGGLRAIHSGRAAPGIVIRQEEEGRRRETISRVTEGLSKFSNAVPKKYLTDASWLYATTTTTTIYNSDFRSVYQFNFIDIY